MTADQPQLHNNRNVYIIGAGFSADAGLPLLGNFMNRMKDALPWLDEQGWDAEVDSIRNLLRFRQESAGAAYRVLVNVENIEDLFSLAAATDNRRLETDLVRAIAGTLSFAEKTATETDTTLDFPKGTPVPSSWRPVGPGQFKANLYDFYVGVLCGHFSGGMPEDSSFISFNYDTIIESAARRLGIPYDYGFSGRRMRFDPGASSSPSSRPGFGLLKVHGSVSWAYPGAKGKKLTPYDSYDAVRNAGRIPVLVPPTWKKGQTKGVHDAWATSISALEQATRIFIVGCSIPSTDAHFRFLLAAGLRNNISLRSIYFVNPSANCRTQRERVMSIFPSHLVDQGILDFIPLSLGWLCGTEGQKYLNRPVPEGLRKV